MPRRTLACLFIVALAAAPGCTVNPVTGKSQLDLMGEAQELELGKSLYPGAVQQSLGPIPDDPLQREVDRVGQSVAAVSHRPGLEYRFTAVNDPSVNAFALPGGKICITRGLLSRLESEDGLAAVLGHEVGHVTARHAVAAYNRQVFAEGILLAGGIYMEAEDVHNRGLIELGAVVGAGLMLAHYSRDQERESDQLGLDYAVKAGYSPRGMVETHKILLALQKSQPNLVDKLFASHPMSAERLQTAERRVAGMPAEVVDRPMRVAELGEATRGVVAERPAWDRASEAIGKLGDATKAADAERSLAEAVRLAPGAGVLRTLHALGLAAVKRPAEAAPEARRGAELAPGVFLSRLVAGEMLLATDPAAALQNSEAAEGLLPGSAKVSLLRGRALESLGRRKEAAAAYGEATKRDPNGEIGAEAARRARALG